MKKFLQLLPLLALPLALSPVARANLILNGGFETGTYTDWTVVPADTGSYYVVAPTFTSFGVAAQEGVYAVAFGAMEDSWDTIYQTFNTVAGQSYDFGFWVHNAAGWSGSMLLATWDSVYLSSQGGNPFPIMTDAGSFDWQQYSFTQLATSTETTISFAGRSNAEWIMLDNISVTELAQPSVTKEGSATVPDAAPTGLLLGLGLLSIAALRRGKAAGAGLPAAHPVA